MAVPAKYSFTCSDGLAKRSGSPLMMSILVQLFMLPRTWKTVVMAFSGSIIRDMSGNVSVSDRVDDAQP